MPWTNGDTVATDAFEGAVEITDAQYQEALDGKMEGKLISLEGGFAMVDPPTPEPEPEPEEPEPDPSSQTLAPFQFFAVLELSGKKAALDAYVDGLTPPANIIARAKLDHTLEFRRDNDLVLAAQQALALTDQELDALWAQAAAIQ